MSFVLGPPGGLERARNVTFVFPDWGDGASWTSSVPPVLGAPIANLVTRQPSQVAGFGVAAADLVLVGTRTARTVLDAVCIPYANATTAATWRIQVGDTAGEAAGTRLADASGNGNHGLPNGTSFDEGKFGRGVRTDGTTSFATPSIAMPGSGTIAFWVQLDTIGTRRTVLEHSNGGTPLLLEILANGYLRFADNFDTSVTLTAETWAHVALVYVTADVVRVYVDGVNVGDTVVAGATLSGSSTIVFGNSATPGSGVAAVFDDVQVFDRVLSGAEIQSLMQQEAATPYDANLQAYYRCNGYDSGTLTFGAPPNLATYTRRCAFHLLPFSMTAQTVRITISDPTNTDVLRIGRLVAGSAYQPFYNFNFGFQLGFKDETKKSRTPGGQTSVKTGGRFPFIDFTISNVSRDELMDFFYELQRRYGTSSPFVVCCDPEDEKHLQRVTLYGLADDLSPMPWQWADGWEASMRFEAMV